MFLHSSIVRASTQHLCNCAPLQLTLPVQRFGDKGTFFTSHDILDHGHRRKPQTFDGCARIFFARCRRRMMPVPSGTRTA